MTFDKVDNAKEYYVEIKKNNEVVSAFVTNINSIDVYEKVANLAAGNFTVVVYADSSDNNVFRSLSGSFVDFVVLDAPNITLKNKQVSWEKVEYATSYDIYVNGVYFDNTSELTYYSRNFSLGNKITIVAKSSSNNHLNSVYSNEVVVAVA